MANSNTEHSRMLRKETANRRNKRLLDEGIEKQIKFSLTDDELFKVETFKQKYGFSYRTIFEYFIKNNRG